MNMAPVPGKSCQAHVEQIPAVAYFQRRWRCAACYERAVSGRKGASPEQRVFLAGKPLPKPLPTQDAPKWRPYVQPKHVTEAFDKALAYSWRRRPSLYE